ncbi:MAG: ABC transporter substrate-binding protein [Desulfurococcaceae archaeon]
MRKKIYLMGVFLVIAVAISMILVNIYTRQPTPSLKQRIVVYAYNDKITGIDPSIEDDTGLVVLGSIYETLTYYDYKTGAVKPRLAINWSVDSGGKEWMFQLRRGVKFHDGTPFNATAVKISIERARDIYRETGRGMGYIWDAVEEIEIIDEYTIKFILKYPQRLDLLASGSYAAYIFSPSVIEKANVTSYMDEKLEDWFNSGNAIGTGPYKLISYDPTREIRLEKYDEWWGWKEINNPNAPDIVIIKIVTEPVAQYNGLLSGEIDIASSIPRENVRMLLEKGFKAINLPTYHNFILFFNTKRYPTNIREFRLAIAHALDISRVIRDALLGYGKPASGIIPHEFPGHVEGLTYEYDLAEARNYLNASGVKLPVTINLLYQVDYEETRKFAEIFKSMMAELGIIVELNPQDWARLKDIAKGVWTSPEETPHLVVADWWPTIPSPYDYLYTMLHSDSKEWNFAGFENKAFDELIDSAWILEGEDYAKAMELYEQAQRLVHEDAVVIGLWDEVRPFVYSSRINMPEDALNPLYMFVIRFELVEVRL